MIKIGTELSKYGYEAVKHYETGAVDIQKNGKKIFELSLEKLRELNNSKEIWQYLKKKLNINDEISK